jgi:sugar-specific transcriptional regulator TrmB
MELEASKEMYEWLDEKTRALLFNQEDYNELCETLNTIENESLRLSNEYEKALSGATANTIEEITSKYQRQYELLMSSYEIAKADLEVAKKKAKLNNVLKERNVRMFIDGKWQWVANTQDVIDAKKEYANAEYEAKNARIQKEQTENIGKLTAQQNALRTTINKFDDGVIDL